MSLPDAITYDGKKIAVLTATGPGSDVSVGAGAAADVDLTIPASYFVVKKILGLTSVSGLPDGLAIAGVSYPDLSTVRVRVLNTTTAAITVSAGSVTASVQVLAV